MTVYTMLAQKAETLRGASTRCLLAGKNQMALVWISHAETIENKMKALTIDAGSAKA